MRKYSPTTKLLKVNGKIVKRIPTESGSQYWKRVQDMMGVDEHWNLLKAEPPA